MKTLKAFLISFIVTIVLGNYIIDHAFSAVPMETSVSNRLAVRGYSIPHIPIIWVNEIQGNNSAAGVYRGTRIDLNRPLLDTYKNWEKALVITHENLHYFSGREGLVEAVAEDEIHRWYKKSWKDLDWSIYGSQVSMWRWYSSQQCSCPWQSSLAQQLRRTYLVP